MHEKGNFADWSAPLFSLAYFSNRLRSGRFFYNQNKMHKKFFYQTIHLLRRHHVIKIDALTTK